MSDVMQFSGSMLAGALAGVLFLALLWAGVRQSIARGQPQVIRLSLILLRHAVVVASFAIIYLDGNWLSLAAALCGFVVARSLLCALVTVAPASVWRRPQGGRQ